MKLWWTGLTIVSKDPFPILILRNTTSGVTLYTVGARGFDSLILTTKDSFMQGLFTSVQSHLRYDFSNSTML